MKQLVKIISVVIVLSGYQTSAAESHADSDMRAKLIGSWIIPKDSSDYQPELARSLETYFADGTEVFSTFQDRACRVVLERYTAKLNVENGVLTTNSAEFGEDKDDILNITDRNLELHSRRDGMIYTRTRATNCGDTSN